MSITGQVGTVYSIEYVSDLAQTNAWRCLTFLQLPATNFLWVDATAPAAGRRFFRAVAFAAPTNMLFIPPGTFRMGSPTNEVGRYGDEGPQTEVMITHGFWIGKYEVTQGEYQALMGQNPSYFRFPEDLNRPVETVSWSDATNYCRLLTQRERSAGRIPTNCVYRLPTEAEWEYACRGLTSTRFGYGEDPGYTNLANYAWYYGNSGLTTHPVGQKLPNAWGLYDTHGNVFEWCLDSFGYYPGGVAIDWQGPATGTDGVVRGGCWGLDLAYGQRFCRTAFRLIVSVRDTNRQGLWGLRVVLAPGGP